MSTVLGIFDGTHDSGACIIRNNQIVSACDTERLSRKKGDGGFPLQAIQACLDSAETTLNQIDTVSFAGLINPNPILRASRKIQKIWTLDNGKFYAPSDTIANWLQFQSPFPRLRPQDTTRWSISKHLLKRMLRRQLRHHLQWSPRQIELYEHHRSHAASAYYGSGFHESTVVVADGIGDGIALSIWSGNGTHLKQQFVLPYPHSLGLLYASFTGFLGYKPFRHEGKLTGLAARGSHQNISIPFPFVGSIPNRRFTQQFPIYEWLSHFESFAPEDIAAWLQHGVEQEIIQLIRWAVSVYGNKPLSLAGGLFANVALNGRIANDINPPDLFVFPNMGDGGLAVGAAYCAGVSRYNWSSSTIQSMMLGPKIQTSSESINRFMQDKPLTHTWLDTNQSIERALKKLSNNQIIARASGRMEYGPRALGNRSILASAADPSIHHTLNQRLNRTEFMPFAPIMRGETASKWLIAPDSAWTAMKWMTVTVKARRELQARCPAIVHVDNTLRPQIIYKEDHPTLWNLLEKFEQVSGQPALINTSFNRHEEPIVATEEDALEAFWESKLDALWLDNWWIETK